MLILSRKHGQRIFIGDDIVITCMNPQYGVCKIGITAPHDMLILREELDDPREIKKAISTRVR